MFNAVDYINTPRWQKVSLGLKRTELLLGHLGNPHKNLKFIHVAGTNGKGSTCAFLESIFRTSGKRTGLFTSPYLMTFEDRIRVSNANISKQQLTEVTLQVKQAAEKVESEMGEHPTEFELMTAVAFLHFAIEKCDIVICEVGLGGRLDSTNVITPEISVITHIGLDHQAILGDTIERIAIEKAGIIKPKVPVVLAPQKDCVYPIIEEVAGRHNAPIFKVQKNSRNGGYGTGIDDVSQNGSSAKPYSLIVSPFCLRMKGSYQLENATVAAEVARLLKVDGADIEAGLRNATWPGRFEIFEGNGLPCKVIVDGAHNVDGARVLGEALNNIEVDPSTLLCSSQDDVEESRTSRDGAEVEAGRERIAVFGALKDKDVSGIVDELGSFFDEWIVYKVDSPRAMESEELASLTAKYATTKIGKSPVNALDFALKESKEKGHQNLIVCFGSLYSLGDIRRHLLRLQNS